ncbi:MAG: hypothetical protein ACJ8CB_22875 [Ktedonobacteraceae bacterium]
MKVIEKLACSIRELIQMVLPHLLGYHIPYYLWWRCTRDEWLNCKTSGEKDSNKQKKRATTTGERFGTYLLYVAIFRGLKPGRYNAWTTWGKERPKSVALSILPGQISELELDWQD